MGSKFDAQLALLNTQLIRWVPVQAAIANATKGCCSRVTGSWPKRSSR